MSRRNAFNNKRLLAEFICLLVPMFYGLKQANALPAFARREDVSCSMCHTNGSAPHLTKTGYMFRRAGYRMPADIGNKGVDEKHFTVNEHLSGGLNFDYEYVRQKDTSNVATEPTNNFNMPEAEIWPVVGAFLGNYGAWSEVDATPTTDADPGGVSLNQANLIYVNGTKDRFYTFRGGLMAPQGVGASDQALDDGGIPLMDQSAPNYNQDTIVTPLGAMNVPQIGAEIGANFSDTHLTMGVYNGYAAPATSTGPTTFANGSLTPAAKKQAKDYKLQVDQFIGKLGVVTATYYSGTVSLYDPSGTFQFTDNFDQSRLYLTAYAIPEKLDIVAGGAYGHSDYVTTSPATTSFTSQGAFLGAFLYPTSYLSLLARWDGYEYSKNAGRAIGYTLQASIPYDNNIFVFHYIRTLSDLAGQSDDLRAEWRFLF